MASVSDDREATKLIDEDRAVMQGFADRVDSELDDEREALESRIQDYGGDDEAGLRESLKGDFDSIESQRKYITGVINSNQNMASRVNNYNEATRFALGEAQNVLRSARFAKTADEFKNITAGAAEKLISVLDKADESSYSGSYLSGSIESQSSSSMAAWHRESGGDRMPKERRSAAEASHAAGVRMGRLARLRVELMRQSLLRGLRSPSYNDSRYRDASNTVGQMTYQRAGDN